MKRTDDVQGEYVAEKAIIPTIMDIAQRLQENEVFLAGQTAPFDEVCSSYL